jgi:hypothetical protein
VICRARECPYLIVILARVGTRLLELHGAKVMGVMTKFVQPISKVFVHAVSTLQVATDEIGLSFTDIVVATIADCCTSVGVVPPHNGTVSPISVNSIDIGLADTRRFIMLVGQKTFYATTFCAGPCVTELSEPGCCSRDVSVTMWTNQAQGVGTGKLPTTAGADKAGVFKCLRLWRGGGVFGIELLHDVTHVSRVLLSA